MLLILPIWNTRAWPDSRTACWFRTFFCSAVPFTATAAATYTHFDTFHCLPMECLRSIAREKSGISGLKHFFDAELYRMYALLANSLFWTISLLKFLTFYATFDFPDLHCAMQSRLVLTYIPSDCFKFLPVVPALAFSAVLLFLVRMDKTRNSQVVTFYWLIILGKCFHSSKLSLRYELDCELSERLEESPFRRTIIHRDW